MSELATVPGVIPADEFANRLLGEALTWLGTPFHGQGKLKQVGVNCGNFIDVCLTAAGADTGDPAKWQTAEAANLTQGGRILLELLKTRLVYVPTESRSPADIIVFCDEVRRRPDEPVHLAFVHQVTDATTFIIEAGRRGVVRHRLNLAWMKRVHSCWRYPR